MAVEPEKVVLVEGSSPFKYPDARRGELVREMVNSKNETVLIPEPYDWLEEKDGEETKAWVDGQVDLFQDYISGSDVTTSVKEQMQSMLEYERYTLPYRVGTNYFYKHNTGLQNHHVLYKLDTLESEPVVLIDPNSLSEDGTTALGSCCYTEDGSYLAYYLSHSGSDWSEIHVKDIATGEDLGEVLKFCKFSSAAWTHDNAGFFYTRYPEIAEDDLGTETDKNENHEVHYHRINTPQSEDVKLFTATQLGGKDYLAGVEITDDGKILIITLSESCADANKLYTLSLDNFDPSDPASCWGGDGMLKLNKVIDSLEVGEYSYIGNDGNLFYCRTNYEAPNKKIITLNIENGEQADLIAETKNKLTSVRIVHGNLLLTAYLVDVQTKLNLFNLGDGSPVETELLDFPPANLSFSGYRNYNDFFVYETSFLTPGVIHKIDFETNEKTLFRQAVVPNFDPNIYQAEQIRYNSKDGTSIPMFLLSSKNYEKSGNAPTLLYGYGGFNISIEPGFSVSRLLWLEKFGGVYAIANIRGGGEYGESWHEQGILDKKQNVFDDFIAAGEYLINEGYTDSNNLVIEGGSNGGLLVGACCNQRPDLFACGLAHVGVMDMLRFNKFTIGYAWVSDFGSPDKPEEFDALYKYSPLHNIPELPEDVQYPNFLALTADHDDRVVPLHTFKFMSELQHKLGGRGSQKRPLMTRIETKGGHGAGLSLQKQISSVAEKLAFVARALCLKMK